MSLVTISQKIAEKLGDVQGIKAVYEYESANPSGQYPLATVTPNNFDGEYASTAHNRRSYFFNVRIYQERTETGFGSEKAERVMREVVDEVMDAFDMDTTLSGTVMFCRPIGGNFDYTEREHDARTAELLLEAVRVVTAQ